MRISQDKIRSKIQRLVQMARDLRTGENFNITRLTVIKSLAAEPKFANRFVLHVAEKAEQALQKTRRPQGMGNSSWKDAQTLAAEAIIELSKYAKRRSKTRETTLRHLRTEIRNLQNEHKNIPWGAVRIIHSRELLIVEKALECVLAPQACAHWAYQVASDYAEHYDSRYPGGLTPASAPYVEDIAEFWCRKHFGKSLEEQFGGE